MSVEPADIRSDRRKTNFRVADAVGTSDTVSRCENFISSRTDRRKRLKSKKLPIQPGGSLSCDCLVFGWSHALWFVRKSVPLPGVGDGKRTPKSKRSPVSFGTKSSFPKIIRGIVLELFRNPIVVIPAISPRARDCVAANVNSGTQSRALGYVPDSRILMTVPEQVF